MALSKIIHLVWYQGFDQAPDHLRGTPQAWRGFNPEWRVMEWDFVSLSSFIVQKYPQYFDRWNRLDQVIKKCDLARLFLVHHFGGVYVDADLIPQRPLDEFLDAGEIRHRQTKHVTRLPKPDPVERVNLRERAFILSREHRPIDRTGSGVANGMLASVPRLPMWLDFIERQIDQTGLKVLDYFGPHALTKFLRERADTLRGSGLILPPYYFLWEAHAMHEPPPSWCVSRHLAINHWGDSSRSDWWNV